MKLSKRTGAHIAALSAILTSALQAECASMTLMAATCSQDTLPDTINVLNY